MPVTQTNGPILRDPRRVADDILFRFGTDSDIVLTNRSTLLASNEEITDVIVGISVHLGAAANSLILSNITQDGDILVLANRGGNSESYIYIDASAGNLELFSRGTGSFDVFDDSSQILDYVSGTFQFQQATSITTLAGALTLQPAGGSGVTVTLSTTGDLVVNTDQFVVDTSAARVGMGTATPAQLLSLGTNIHLFSVTAGGEIAFNETALDIDFRVEGDTNATLFVADAGTDTVSFGAAAAASIFFNEQFPARTISTGTEVWRHNISIGGAITVNIVTLTEVVTCRIVEPNITIGSGAVTMAASLWIVDAPTEATNNYALFVDAGGVRLDGARLDINLVNYSWPSAQGTAGTQLQTDGANPGVLSWAGAGSWRKWKALEQPLNPQVALDAILGVTPWYFHYRPDATVSTRDFETLYAGVMADEAPWAMHHGGQIFSPVNAFGYTVGAIQSVHEHIHKLEGRIAELEARYAT